MTTGNEIVDAIGKLAFSGNITPNSWFQAKEFRYDSGKVNLLAIVILADTLYWYRPTEVVDEATGYTVGFKKKFAADKMQRQYSALAAKFGCSKRQATDACHFLRDKGLITLEFRILHKAILQGRMTSLSNVLYITPVPEAVAKLLDPPLTFERDIPPTLERDIPPTLERETYTYTTTESSTNNSDLVKAKNPQAEQEQEQTQIEDQEQPQKQIKDQKQEQTQIEDQKPNPNQGKGQGKIESQKPNSATIGLSVPEFILGEGTTMKAADILKAKAIMEHGVCYHWQSRKALQGGFQKALTQKEKGQLGRLSKALGDQIKPVITWSLENWQKFMMEARAQAGLSSGPVTPDIGFLLKYHAVAVNMYVQSIASAKPVKYPDVGYNAGGTLPLFIEVPKVKAQAQAQKEAPYMPSEAEIQQLLDDLKA